ncbi:rhoGAP domain-containing protein [Hirsutella rhossiliensis]|uniref:RhoGAP domain-containing protein n=1 Tax=Hirsutella rhossiliensis TaxID=111463 RepID=A0A9P8SCP3_9HYPO|nr:rhoGAP domain-containing protein [Hirsutella rhossiliensis]KAH0957094.1 rhoGAP domain-containing protein [Hirsutella rhossiliensis]
MGRTRRLSASKSSQHLRPPRAAPHHRLPTSASSVSLPFPHSASVHSLLAAPSQVRSSGTWTTSSGELGLLSDTDEVEDRAIFVHEYNRLARKHGVRLLIVDDFEAEQRVDAVRSPEKRGWLHRLLRSSPHHDHPPPPGPPPPRQLQPRHRRSVSDLAHIIRSRREPPRVICIQEMVRLSGKSMMYLPQDYSPCSLVLPTCLRATAQYLAQNAATRGVFRVSGSVRTVSALFDYYCRLESGGDDIAGTVRCANLPLYISYSVHDVASTFKRLLSVLPGGILGSLALFDALVAIHSQLNGEPEFPRTKQTKVRARLIALAIGTIKSQFRRELVCAVVGLLSLIGRVAEVTPREDADGRPLPTADLMGYHALGIVFGPLLMGDLLDQYTMKLAAPTAGMLLLPLSPHRLLRGRKTKAENEESGPPTVNKILVANGIAEMLIANWRDVVRQMKSLGTHHRRDVSLVNLNNPSLRPSASQAFTIKMPQDMDAPKDDQAKRHSTPEPDTPTAGLRRRRPRSLVHAASHKLLPKMSVKTLSPTKEESLTDDEGVTAHKGAFPQGKEEAAVGRSSQSPKPTVTLTIPEDEDARGMNHGEFVAISNITPPAVDNQEQPLQQPKATSQSNPRVHLDTVPPRISSRSRHEHDSSETAQKIMSYSGGGFTELLSPDPLEGRIGRMQGRFRKARSSNNVGSYDGSDDSAGPSYCPRNDKKENQTEFMSPREKRISRLCNAHSPHGHGSADFGRNAVLPGSEASEISVKGNETQLRPAGKSLDDVGRIAPNNSTWTPRNNVDGRRSTEHAQRGSIGSTPKLLYPRESAQQNRQWKRSSDQDSETADGDAVPRSLDLVKYVEPGQQAKPDGQHNPPRQVTAYEKSPSSRQSRAFRSPGPWRGPIKLQVQSPMQSSSSGALSKRGSVKAIAALFKSQGSAEDRPMLPGKGKCTEENASRQAPAAASPRKCGQLSKAGLETSRDDSDKSPRSCIGKKDAAKNSTSGNSDSDVEMGDGQSTCAVDGDAVAAPRVGARRSMPALHQSADEGPVLCGRLKPVPSLGTMVPYREQPPIAQHLNLVRPLSTPAPGRSGIDGAPTTYFTPPSKFESPTSSTTVLYAQVQSLQRSLSAKADEASQLRRQLEAQDSAEVGTLSEQLRTARRDLSTWRERAEAAEKRIQVFERFTSRLRGIKASMSMAQQRPAGNNEDGDNGKQQEDGPLHKALPKNLDKKPKSEGSDDSGKTEDDGVVSARIRRCLHGHSSLAAAHDEGLDGSRPGVSGVDGALSPVKEHHQALFMDGGADDVWAAAEELLRMEDNGVL